MKFTYNQKKGKKKVKRTKKSCDAEIRTRHLTHAVSHKTWNALKFGTQISQF